MGWAEQVGARVYKELFPLKTFRHVLTHTTLGPLYLNFSMWEHFVEDLRFTFSCSSLAPFWSLNFSQVPLAINVSKWTGQHRHYRGMKMLTIAFFYATKNMHHEGLRFFDAHWPYSFPVPPVNVLILIEVPLHLYTTTVFHHHLLP